MEYSKRVELDLVRLQLTPAGPPQSSPSNI